MTQLYEVKVKLSKNRKRNLSRAFHLRETIVLRLSHNALSRSDTLYVPSSIVKRLNKNRRVNKGMDIQLANTNIRKQVRGSLLTSILSMGRALLPAIGIPLAMELVKKITGRGAPRVGRYLKQDGHGAPRLGMYETPPFIGTWEQMRGRGKKTNHTVKPKFHKNIPMSNHDLLECCRYLNIPIKSVLARDQTVPHDHQQSLFIYNLEPSYMNGSHWVATYVKNNTINSFDSFGMPPFQEIINHARSKNLTLLHQDNQVQNIITTTCGYFCLYFLNEMIKGTSCYDLLGAFDMHDTIKK